MIAKNSQKGFTIVELLIVIVVIAILAAISVVAYNGIQNRAKTNSGQQVASQVQKKIEALNAIKGTYFATAGAQTVSSINTLADAAPAAAEAKIDNTASITSGTGNVPTAAGTHNFTATLADNGKTIAVWGCANGANIWYWDFAASSAVQVRAGTGC